MHDQKTLTHLKWACRSIIFFAIGVSVWGNALHAKPGFVPLFLSSLPPVLVYLGYEVISRVPVPKTAPKLVKAARVFATIAISGIGAYLSYFHQRDAFFRYTGDMQSAMLLPGSIDGLMIIASVSLLLLNEYIRQLKVSLTASSVKTTKPAAVPQPRKGQGRGAKKEAVAQILARNPGMSPKELARRAGVSVSYATTLSRELAAANGAELLTSDR